jgi:hypothetical protein
MVRRVFNQPGQESDASRPKTVDPLFNLHVSESGQALAKIANHIEASGNLVTWYKAIFCPCRDAQTLHPKFDCELCDGRGIYYVDPQETRVIIQSRMVRREQKSIGVVEMGTCSITWPLGAIPGAWDKIVEHKEIAVITNEILTRGATNRLGNSLEKCRYKSVIKVEMAMDAEGVRYAEGINFKLVNDRFIAWTGPAPVDGMQYALRYQAHPEYIIMNSEPVFRMEGDDLLPYRSIAQRLEFVDRES